MRLAPLTLAVAAAAVATGSAAAGADPVPPPSGASTQVRAGAALFQQHCALCHGATGRDAAVFPRPIWGAGHDIAKFGHARGLFEYVQLLMPFDNPAKLDDTAKTAVVAYMLVRNGDLKPAEVLPLGGNQTAIGTR